MKEIGNTRKNRGLLLLLAVCLLLSACGKGASSPAAAAETSAGMAREDMIYNEESGMAPGSTDYKSETAEPSGMTSSSEGIQPVNTKRRKKPEKRPDYGPYPVRSSVCLYNGGGG